MERQTWNARCMSKAARTGGRSTTAVGRTKVGRLGERPDPAARTVVVGYDSTALGRAAVVEAGLRAGLTGCVFVVYAYRNPPGFLGSPLLRATAEHRSSHRPACPHQPPQGPWRLAGRQYVPELLGGPPADALMRVAAARSADEIVVGARHAGRLRGVLGTVTRTLLRTAEVPVITIPESAPPDRGSTPDDRSGSSADRGLAIPDVSRARRRGASSRGGAGRRGEVASGRACAVRVLSREELARRGRLSLLARRHVRRGASGRGAAGCDRAAPGWVRCRAPPASRASPSPGERRRAAQ